MIILILLGLGCFSMSRSDVGRVCFPFDIAKEEVFEGK